MMDTLYNEHAALSGDVRFVFESITGMQELWGGEDQIGSFYSHSCPRLYELNTIAYWIMEKRAHSPRLRAQINQIAQVAIDLSVRRGKTYLTILKAENHNPDVLNRPYQFWGRALDVSFDFESSFKGKIDLGLQLKRLREKRGLPQTELAKLIGVTPSTISQIESNQIYPSIPALLKMAEVLSVEVSSLLGEKGAQKERIVYPASESVEVKLPHIPDRSAHAKLLTPIELDSKADAYLIEISPNETLSSHFFIHKGVEIGYLLSGSLELKVNRDLQIAGPGDMIYLTSEIPSQWRNIGPDIAKLLWIKIK